MVTIFILAADNQTAALAVLVLAGGIPQWWARTLACGWYAIEFIVILAAVCLVRWTDTVRSHSAAVTRLFTLAVIGLGWWTSAVTHLDRIQR